MDTPLRPSEKGSGRSNTASITLKIALLAPIPRVSVAMATAENAGFLISCRTANQWLFITQRNHGVDTRGTTRGHETGNGRD